jgi:dihydrofolate reductase
MRELIVTQNISIDGVIEAGDWFGPADGGPEVLEAMRGQMSRADAFLTGRVTFEEMRSFWPAQHDDTSGVSAYLNQVQKYVVSSTLQDPEWEPTTILRGRTTYAA